MSDRKLKLHKSAVTPTSTPGLNQLRMLFTDDVGGYLFALDVRDGTPANDFAEILRHAADQINEGEKK